jgi:hypothetical protein
MIPKRLSRLLQPIVSLSIASAGCGGIDTTAFTPVPCAGDGGPDYLSGLRLTEPADYLELHTIASAEQPSGGVVQTFGTKCAAAQDKDACSTAIAAATSTTGFFLGQCVQICQEHFLVVNRGNSVSVVAAEQEVLDLLAPIDAPADAVLIAALARHTITCGDADTSGVHKAAGGYEVLSQRYTSSCNPLEVTQYVLKVSPDGDIVTAESAIVSSEAGVCIGRRPAGLKSRRAIGGSRVGAYFASIAHLEAASVHAFATLARELTQHGAPAPLVRGAQRSMRDEVRHAELTRRLAARHGGAAPRPRVERHAVRSLEAVATENAVEGCVRETFGALVGAWQAQFAGDPVVRRVLCSIARDEARHASLAWAVDGWARSKLDRAAWRRVERARREALDALAHDPLARPDPELVRWAGVPDAASHDALTHALRRAIAA